MLKMLIRMNNDKIIVERKYNLEGIYSTINKAFTQMGFQGTFDDVNTFVYHDNGNARDYGRFGKIVNSLKKQAWFMENVTDWRLYDSDDSDDPEEFNEEDLLSHYRNKRAMGA